MCFVYLHNFYTILIFNNFNRKYYTYYMYHKIKVITEYISQATIDGTPIFSC